MPGDETRWEYLNASCHAQGSDLVIGKDTRADQEADAFAVLEREHTAASGNYIENKLSVFPVFELAAAHIKRRIAKRANQNIAVAEQKFASWIAHRRTTIATAARLVKHKVAMFSVELRHQFDGSIGGEDLIGNARHGGLTQNIELQFCTHRELRWVQNLNRTEPRSRRSPSHWGCS